MNKLKIIIKNTYLRNIKSASFIFMTLSPIIILLIGVGIFYFIQQSEENKYGEIAVLNATPEIQQIIENNKGNNKVIFESDQATVSQELEEDKIDGYLVVTDNNNRLEAAYYAKSDSKDVSLSQFSQALSHYQLEKTSQALGLSSEQVAAVKDTEVTINPITVKVNQEGKQSEESRFSVENMLRQGVAYVVNFIVFMIIIFYVGMIGQEVAVEKGSKIMETILSSVSARVHFFGKVIGVFLLVITQIVIYILLGCIGSFVTSRFFQVPSNIQPGEVPTEVTEMMGSIDLSSAIHNALQVIGMGALYAIFGMLMYVGIGALLGSLVTKTEDIQKFTMPITFIGFAGFYIGIYSFVAQAANSTFVIVCSQIPFLTPFIMPFRVASNSVGVGGILLSIVLNIITIVLVFWFASTFYKSNVLTYSDGGFLKSLKHSWVLWRSERREN